MVATHSLVSVLPLSLLPLLVSAYTFIDNPAVGGDSENGWTELPPVPGADLITDWPISGTESTFPVYRTSGLDNSVITRAVIVPGAKDRDHWSYWITMRNILGVAAEEDTSINADAVSIMTPCFLAQVDVQAGAGNSTQLYWSKTGWFSGTYAEGPSADDKISSFNVLDNLISHYTDKSLYPNLQEVVFAGHSAAAQMFQRYAALRTETDNDDSVHYIVANPGSFMWLVNDRPAPNSSCSDVNRYKYGMSDGFPGYATADFNKLKRSGLVERYRGRNVHYAHGTADNGPGDTTCQAVTQGSTHLERGQNFVSLLESMTGGMPSTHTIDWIEGVSHQNDQMYNSSALRQRLFKDATVTSSGTRPALASTYVTSNDTNSGALISRQAAGVLALTLSVFVGTVGAMLL